MEKFAPNANFISECSRKNFLCKNLKHVCVIRENYIRKSTRTSRNTCLGFLEELAYKSGTLCIKKHTQ